MKKVLSLVLAVMMVLSMMTMALANTSSYTDISAEENKKLSDAAEKLTALGLFEGYPDGSFGPGKEITRAELITLIVRGTGNEDASKGATSSFTDSRGQWYDGYVAVGESIGIVNGYPDGTFKGNEVVSYGHATTMLMRMLGYNNRSVNMDKNSYAYSEVAYKVAAQRIGMFAGVEYKNEGANRGDVALMMYNILDANIVLVGDNGIAEDKVVIKNNQPQALTFLSTLIKDKIQSKVVEADDYFANPELYGPYLGEEIQYIEHKNGIYIFSGEKSTTHNIPIIGVSETSPAELGLGTSTELQIAVKYANANATEGYIVNIDTKDSGKETGTKLFAYLNGVELGLDSKDDDESNEYHIIKLREQEKYNQYNTGYYYDNVVKYNKEGTEVVDDGVPRYEEYPQTTLDPETFKVKVVDSGATRRHIFEAVNNIFQVTAPYKEGIKVFQGIDLPLGADGNVDFSKILVEGAASTIQDILVDDVVEAYIGYTVDGAVERIRFVVTRSSMTGIIEKATYKPGTTEHITYTIGGETYGYNPLADRTFRLRSQLNGILIAKVAEGTFYFDQLGRIAFVRQPQAQKNYGLVVDIEPGKVSRTSEDFSFTITNPVIRLIDAEGKVQRLEVPFVLNTNANANNGLVIPSPYASYVKDDQVYTYQNKEQGTLTQRIANAFNAALDDATPKDGTRPKSLPKGYSYTIDLKQSDLVNIITGESFVALDTPTYENSKTFFGLDEVGGIEPTADGYRARILKSYGDYTTTPADGTHYEPVRDFFVEYSVSGNTLTGLVGADRYPEALRGSKNANNFYATENTVILLKQSGDNNYKKVELNDLSGSFTYQYTYGWNMVVITDTAKAAADVIYGVINNSVHTYTEGHIFTGYFLNASGILEGEEKTTQTTSGDIVTRKKYDGVEYVDVPQNPYVKLCDGVNAAIDSEFADDFMPNLLRMQKEGSNIVSVATASAIGNKEYLNFTIDQAGYIDYKGANNENKQLSANLVVFQYNARTRQFELLCENREDFQYRILQTNVSNIEMTMYQLEGSGKDIIDVIVVTNWNKK